MSLLLADVRHIWSQATAGAGTSSNSAVLNKAIPPIVGQKLHS